MSLQPKPTKTQNAIDLLRQTIVAGSFKKGDRLPSSRVLATRLGVSQIVIRNAFRRLEQDGMLECRHGSGTYFKRSTVRRQTIAILTEQDIASPRASYFYRCLIEQTRQALERAGCRVILFIGRQQPGTMDYRHRDAIDDLTEAHADDPFAAVVMVSGLLREAWRRKCQALGVPMVGPFYPPDSVFLRSSYTIDYRGMIAAAVARFAASGARRPALVSWDKTQAAVFKSCVVSAGMKFRRELMHFWNGHAGNSGYHGFRRIWSRTPALRPDAVLFTDDILFMDARLALAEFGIRIPEQLQVITHYNLGSEILIPFPATLLAIDPGAVAAELAEMVLELAANPRAAGRTREFHAQLIEHKPRTR